MDATQHFERAIALLDGQARLAEAIQKSPAMVWQVSAGRRRCPVDWCERIERATGGEVTCEQLRPDLDWWRDSKGRAFSRMREAA